jgi:hypothetical protein
MLGSRGPQAFLIAAFLSTASLALAQRGPGGPGVNPNYSGYMNFSGTITPSVADLELHQLIFYETDGSTFLSLAGPLSGVCPKITGCSFNVSVGYIGPTNYQPNLVAYSIMGFYDSGGGTFGPSFPSDFDVNSVAVANEHVFAVTSTSFSPGQSFETFFPANFGIYTAENGVATTFFNGNTLVADGIPFSAFANFQQVPVGGALTGGQILDFTNGAFNGNVSIGTSFSATAIPEPVETILIGGGLALLGVYRFRRRQMLGR